MALNVTIARRGKDLWRMNVTPTKEVPFYEKQLNIWVRCKQREKILPHVSGLVGNGGKGITPHHVLARRGRERRRQIKNFYYLF
jgi:hypothetical protein